MNFKKFFAALTVCTVCFTSCASAETPVPTVSAASAILIDADTGRVLFEKNADEPMLIASTTKIMTALVVLENCSIDQVVKVAEECVGVEGSSIYLRAGEELTVQQLLYGMLLKSGNDAAAALAVHTAGSVDAFAELMNAKAQQLGLENSSFANPHGLDEEGHYSSARDLAVITMEAMQYDVFCQIVSTESITIGDRYMTNHNKLLKFYDGATGVKTGYTQKAGRSLVSSAEKDGMTLIAVTLSDPDDWTDHTNMLDYGFENYHTETLCTEEEVITHLPVIGGEAEDLAVKAEETSTATVGAGENVTAKICLPHFVYAQVEEGCQVGSVKYYVNQTQVAEVPLLAAETVERVAGRDRTFWEKLCDGLRIVF